MRLNGGQNRRPTPWYSTRCSRKAGHVRSYTFQPSLRAGGRLCRLCSSSYYICRSPIDHGREDPPAQLVAATAAALGLGRASLMIKEIWDLSCTFHTVSQMIVQTVMIPLPPSLVLLRALISPCLHELSALLHVLCAVPCCVLCRCLSV